MNVYELRQCGERIKGNPYVGRGIVAGKTCDGKHAAIAYFIMGRSENSRNRIFLEKDGCVLTAPFDESKVKDPSLIIYNAVRNYKNNLIVTNGNQTDTIYDYVSCGKTFEAALDTREFEPDGPNFTPRISAMLTFENGDFSYQMSILKSSDPEGRACSRFLFKYPALSGIGHFIHTYITDGNPIPTFLGEPERVIIPDNPDEFAYDIWNNLDDNNKISLYVRYCDLNGNTVSERMVNKNK